MRRSATSLMGQKASAWLASVHFRFTSGKQTMDALRGGDRQVSQVGEGNQEGPSCNNTHDA
jgi:hypothetical protein